MSACLIVILTSLLVIIFNLNKNDAPIEITSFADTSLLSTINTCSKLPKQPNEINIVTYNIGDDRKVCKECDPDDRMKALMDLFKNNHADIIALQEVWLRRKGKPEFLDDMKSLLPILETEYNYVYRGHADDALTTKGIPNHGSDYGNMIITKLPIRQDSYKEYLIDKKTGDGEGQRYFFSVVIESPDGPIRIYNIHTRAGESPWGVTEAAKFLKSISSAEPAMPLIVLGDFNQGMQYIQSQLGDSQYGLNINFGCTNAALCFSAGIDLIFPNDKATIVNRCQGSADSNGLTISGGHVPVYATFKLLNPITPTPAPTPLPTPSPISSPTVTLASSPTGAPSSSPTVTPVSSPTVTIQDKSNFDLKQDGEIDIQDFMIFVSYYKISDCRIDYNSNNNCKDIEDFLIFINEYKRYQN